MEEDVIWIKTYVFLKCQILNSEFLNYFKILKLRQLIQKNDLNYRWNSYWSL